MADDAPAPSSAVAACAAKPESTGTYVGRKGGWGILGCCSVRCENQDVDGEGRRGGGWTYIEIPGEIDAGSLLLAVQIKRLADKVLNQLDPVSDVLQGGRRDRGM